MALEVHGKFMRLDGAKFHIKALSISDLGPDRSDIAGLGVNTVCLAVPSAAACDECDRHGLKVIADLGFGACLDSLTTGRRDAVANWRRTIRRRVGELAHHPALLAFDLGGPAADACVRRLGAARVRAEIERAIHLVKRLAPDVPVTCTLSARDDPMPRYCDFLSWQVDPDSLSEFRATLSRLQARAGDMPMLVRVVAADSAVLGEQAHAQDLEQRIRMTFNAGCAGLVLANWRDDVETTARPGVLDAASGRKLAYDIAAATMGEVPFPPWLAYPRISVVVCVYNGEHDIEECLEGVAGLDYPDFEVIVVDDGSTDRSFERAERQVRRHGWRIVRQASNQGLSAARNRGLREADGEIIAYLDSDAYPERDWLRYLAQGFLSTRNAVVGGPNINPRSGSDLSDCIDKAPGNPQMVMVEDECADHVPGCNLAVRRSFLLAIGGFDERYRGGGDDVTFCWTVAALGATCGAAFGAMVWHHRRRTVAGFLRQQIGYGKGEARLAKDWPERFNAYGHQVHRIAGPGIDRLNSEEPPPVVLGVYTPASLVGPAALARFIGLTPAMPEWALLSLLLALVSLLGIRWPLYGVFAVPAVAGLAFWLAAACRSAMRLELRHASLAGYARLIALHLAQPAARFYGRCLGGMPPWRSRCSPTAFRWPRSKRYAWPHGAASRPVRGTADWPLAQALQRAKLPVKRGGGGQAWDWSVEAGIFGGARCLRSGDTIAVWPYIGHAACILAVVLAFAIAVGAMAGAIVPLAAFCMFAVLLSGLAIKQAGEAIAALEACLQQDEAHEASFWRRFLPPVNFFVDLALPENEALLRAQGVVTEDERPLVRSDLQQDRAAGTVERVADNG